MKKHPILKYILILIVSGACGALVSYLIASREEQVVQAAQGLYQLFGQLVTPLHLSICLFLSLTAIVMTWQLRKKIDTATDETREQVYEQIENSPACNNTLAVSSLSTICNFFFLGAAIAYMQPRAILIAVVATLAFLSLNTWVEYTHVALADESPFRQGRPDVGSLPEGLGADERRGRKDGDVPRGLEELSRHPAGADDRLFDLLLRLGLYPAGAGAVFADRRGVGGAYPQLHLCLQPEGLGRARKSGGRLLENAPSA